MERAWRLVALLAGSLAVGACVQDGDEHAPGADGREMFERYCRRCHGVDGAGNFFKGTPPNRITRLDKGEIADLILRGDEDHPKMPTFPKLSREEALVLAGHVHWLRDKSGGKGVFWLNPPIKAAEP